jgi:hypothetical protein
MEVFTGSGEANSYEPVHGTEAFKVRKSGLGESIAVARRGWPHSGIVLPTTYFTENNGT